mgnify:CR=1 FL=1
MTFLGKANTVKTNITLGMTGAYSRRNSETGSGGLQQPLNTGRRGPAERERTRLVWASAPTSPATPSWSFSQIRDLQTAITAPQHAGRSCAPSSPSDAAPRLARAAGGGGDRRHRACGASQPAGVNGERRSARVRHQVEAGPRIPGTRRARRGARLIAAELCAARGRWSARASPTARSVHRRLSPT